MTQPPEELEFDLGHLRMSALAWGPADGRLALCVHGFPDSAHGWNRLAPLLADKGFRVVAPFTRGYFPSAIPADGEYGLGALMFDVLRLHERLGSPADAVAIGHDWGGMTVGGIAALPDTPFAAHIGMAAPPLGAIMLGPRDALRSRRMLLKQLKMSWYIQFFQLPMAPERSLPQVIPRLWRNWTAKGFDTAAGAADALAALPALPYRRAAVGYYRAIARPAKPAGPYAAIHPYRTKAPTSPMLYLHGADDGAMHPGFAEFVERSLPPGSRVHTIADVGHFMQLEQPEDVAAQILGYLGLAS